MTVIEDRLTRALEARADQVRPEHLAPGEPLTRSESRHRRILLPALAAGVAAALVIVVVIVASQDDGTEQQPVDRPTLSDRPTATDRPSPTLPVTPPLPKLLPEDDDRWVAEGRDATFPDGSIGTLGRTDLTIIFENSDASVGLPDYSGAPGSLSQVQLEFAARPLEVPYGHGYLVRHTAGGFDALDVVVGTAGGGLVVVTPNLDSVPFGVSDPLYDTWTSENGAGLYTRVRVGPASGRFEVYRWVTAVEGRDVVLRPLPLGAVCMDLEASTYERC